MGVIAADKELSAANEGAEPQTIWQRIARGIGQALDRFVVDRSRRAVPAVVLRRSKYDHDRCRRLMLGDSVTPAAVGLNRAQAHRAGRTPQIQS
jgi:hypothetical protein